MKLLQAEYVKNQKIVMSKLIDLKNLIKIKISDTQETSETINGDKNE